MKIFFVFAYTTLAILCVDESNAQSFSTQETAPPPPVRVAKPADFDTACAYPDWAQKANAEGRTLLSYRLAPDGDITDVVILKSSGNTSLDTASSECLNHWRGDRSWIGSDGFARRWVVWMLHGWLGGPPGGYRFAPVGSPPQTIGAQGCADWYPQAERQANIGGRTRVGVHVALDGAVSSVRVLQSSGNDNLDAAGIACVKSWQFKPGTVEGISTEGDARIDIVWQPG